MCVFVTPFGRENVRLVTLKGQGSGPDMFRTLEPNISKTAGDKDSVTMEHLMWPIGNGIWWIEWSRDRWRHPLRAAMMRVWRRFRSLTDSSSFYIVAPKIGTIWLALGPLSFYTDQRPWNLVILTNTTSVYFITKASEFSIAVASWRRPTCHWLRDLGAIVHFEISLLFCIYVIYSN